MTTAEELLQILSQDPAKQEIIRQEFKKSFNSPLLTKIQKKELQSALTFMKGIVSLDTTYGEQWFSIHSLPTEFAKLTFKLLQKYKLINCKFDRGCRTKIFISLYIANHREELDSILNTFKFFKYRFNRQEHQLNLQNDVQQFFQEAASNLQPMENDESKIANVCNKLAQQIYCSDQSIDNTIRISFFYKRKSGIDVPVFFVWHGQKCPKFIPDPTLEERLNPIQESGTFDEFNQDDYSYEFLPESTFYLN